MPQGSDPFAPTRSISPSPAEGRTVRADGLAAGDVVGRYTVRRALGAGGMGRVYEAEDGLLRRRVALKLLLDDEDPRDAARLLREARAAAGLAHPNIVAVHEVGTHGGSPFIAMELVAGTTLRHWLAAAPRDWRAIVSVFRQAGHGLAAAHAAGIVHRDVKPDNILVGDDGRVRVADFGLARDAGLAQAPAAPPRLDEEFPLTQDGAIVGTPHYMAPEQFVGGRLDARADQYAFCVALRDALKTPPAWLERVIRRGLSRDPAARWPDMATVVAELGRDPARRRRLLAVALGAVVTAAALAALAYRAGRPPDPCAAAEQGWAGVWDPTRRAALGAAFAATGKPRATAAFERIAARLDGYARDWTRAHEQSCRATRERGRQSEHLFDLREGCLERERRRVDALVGVLLAKPGDAFESATDAVRDVTSELCQDDEALLAAYPRPADPETRARVAAVERELQTLRVMGTLGRPSDAAAGLRELHARALEVGHPPLVAAATYALAYNELSLRHLDDAIPLLNEAARAGAAARDDEIAARALIDLIFVHGNLKEDHKTATALVPAAEAAVARRELPNVRGRLAGILAGVYQKRGEFREARVQAEQALRQFERGGRTRAQASALINLANLERVEGRHAVAQMYFLRAVEIAIERYGEENIVAADAWQGLGLSYMEQFRFADARVASERALAIFQAALPPGNRRILIQLENLGYLALTSHDLDEAERRYDATAALAAETVKPADPVRGPILLLGGSIDLERKRFARAHERCGEAVSVLDAVGRRDQHIVEARTCLGNALLGEGKPAEAITALEPAVAQADALPLPAAKKNDTRAPLVQALWRTGRRDEARALGRRILDETPEADRARVEAVLYLK